MFPRTENMGSIYPWADRRVYIVYCVLCRHHLGKRNIMQTSIHYTAFWIFCYQATSRYCNILKDNSFLHTKHAVRWNGSLLLEARLKDARGSNLVACKPSQTRGDFFGESDPEIKPVLLYWSSNLRPVRSRSDAPKETPLPSESRYLNTAWAEDFWVELTLPRPGQPLGKP